MASEIHASWLQEPAVLNPKDKVRRARPLHKKPGRNEALWRFINDLPDGAIDDIFAVIGFVSSFSYAQSVKDLERIGKQIANTEGIHECDKRILRKCYAKQRELLSRKSSKNKTTGRQNDTNPGVS